MAVFLLEKNLKTIRYQHFSAIEMGDFNSTQREFFPHINLRKFQTWIKVSAKNIIINQIVLIKQQLQDSELPSKKAIICGMFHSPILCYFMLGRAHISTQVFLNTHCFARIS